MPFQLQCYRCPIPIDGSESYKEIKLGNKTVYAHQNHSADSVETIEAFYHGLAWFGGTKPKQNFPQDNR